jgi:hypothetical protein
VVREDPHEINENEGQQFAIGRNTYMIANTTQMDGSSFKAYGKWHLANVKVSYSKIPKMVSTPLYIFILQMDIKSRTKGQILNIILFF